MSTNNFTIRVLNWANVPSTDEKRSKNLSLTFFFASEMLFNELFVPFGGHVKAVLTRDLVKVGIFSHHHGSVANRPGTFSFSLYYFKAFSCCYNTSFD
jgi:hypothetical protein